jgi:hypothetical protein
MNNTPILRADSAAETLIRHFQAAGFAGISEALIVQISPTTADRAEIEAAFEDAHDQDKPAPVRQYFEISPFGHYSDFRSFADARAAFPSDFTDALRMELPKLFFDAAPVVIEDALASSTKYDVLMKITDNIDGYAIGILLNDPDASFLEYIGTHHGKDWQQIMDNLTSVARSLTSAEKSLL